MLIWNDSAIPVMDLSCELPCVFVALSNLWLKYSCSHSYVATSSAV